MTRDEQEGDGHEQEQRASNGLGLGRKTEKVQSPEPIVLDCGLNTDYLLS